MPETAHRPAAGRWARAIVPAAALALWAFTGGVSQSQDAFPSQTVKIVVPVPAGSAPDFLARLFGARLQNDWKQPFIIENRPGGSQNIGADYVYRAKPDGYTLLSAPPPPFSLNQHLFKDLRFDPSKFAAVTIMASVPNVLVVRPDLGVDTVQQFAELARNKKGGLIYGSTGTGSTLHLSAEMLKSEVKADFVHVPFKGVSEVLTDFLGGRLDFAFLNLLDAFPHIQSGKLKAIGFGSEKRDPAFPNVPALQEIWPGFVTGTWFAIAAPPETPMEIRTRLADGIRAAFQEPAAAKRLQDLHATAVLNTPDEAQAYMRADSERWRKVIVANKITVQ
jgi:tripartite-type tricarboxylate transporter receptor subunit TctC